MAEKEKKRVPVCTTLDEGLYNDVQVLALQLTMEKKKEKKKVNANDLIEEGIELVKKKYNFQKG